MGRSVQGSGERKVRGLTRGGGEECRRVELNERGSRCPSLCRLCIHLLSLLSSAQTNTSRASRHSLPHLLRSCSLDALYP